MESKSRFRKACKAILLLGLLGAVCFGLFWRPVLTGLGDWLMVEMPLQKADLIVALGGDRRRQEDAARLLRDGWAERILFLGGEIRETDYRCLGISTQEIAGNPRPAYRTVEEAEVTRELAHQLGLKDVLVVSSSYHSRRVLWTFERIFDGSGIGVSVYLAPESGFSMARWWESYLGRKAVVMEYLGLLLYWVTV